MKAYFIIIILCLPVLLLAQKDTNIFGHAPYTITVYVKPPVLSAVNKEKIIKTVTTPGKINRSLIKQQLALTSKIGLWAAYSGFCSVSDADGKITFPRYTTKDELDYVVTQRIKPVILRGSTVNHFIIPPSAEAAYFHLTKIKTDASTLWEVASKPTPENRRVPSNGIVFFAKPEHLEIDTGSFATLAGPSWLLPTIFAKKNFAPASNALLFLKVSKYFSPVKLVYQKARARYATLIRPDFAS